MGIDTSAVIYALKRFLHRKQGQPAGTNRSAVGELGCPCRGGTYTIQLFTEPTNSGGHGGHGQTHGCTKSMAQWATRPRRYVATFLALMDIEPIMLHANRQ